MKKIIYAFNIIAALPAALVVPLLPFVFILIHDEGRIPGLLHENAVKILMFVYPLALLCCVTGAIKLTRQARLRPAMVLSLIPLVIFMLLAAIFFFGGVRLR